MISFRQSDTIKNLNSGPDRSEQTVQLQIKGAVGAGYAVFAIPSASFRGTTTLNI